jgi:transcriptional regulator with XRE-family HTH domain
MGDKEGRSLAEVVAANVRSRRAGLGLTQPDLVAAMKGLGQAKWSPSKVSAIEDGKRSITVDELVTLLFVLGATLEEMLDPVAYGDETPVRVAGMRLDPRALRALIRGDLRVRVRGEGDGIDYRISHVERGAPATLEEMLARPQEFFARPQEEQ